MIEEPHKRYLVFAFAKFYPIGGFKDFQDSFDTIEEAKAANFGVFNFIQIYDRVEGVLIEVNQ